MAPAGSVTPAGAFNIKKGIQHEAALYSVDAARQLQPHAVLRLHGCSSPIAWRQSCAWLLLASVGSCVSVTTAGLATLQLASLALAGRGCRWTPAARTWQSVPQVNSAAAKSDTQHDCSASDCLQLHSLPFTTSLKFC